MSWISKLTFIFLINLIFPHDQKVKTKMLISWERKELLRRNKKHSSWFLKGYRWSKKNYFWKVKVRLEVLYITLPHTKENRCLNEVIQQITRNKTFASLQQFYNKMWVGFWLNMETHTWSKRFPRMTNGKNEISSAKLY